jgi:protein-disulfide isomerase
MDENITFSLRKSHFYAILILVAFGVGLLSGYVWGARSSPEVAVLDAPVPNAAVTQPTQPSAPPPRAAATLGSQSTRYEVPTEGYPSLGPADAKVVIVEFSDFECPFCRRFFQNTYGDLLAAYPDKVRFVYRNFPLTSIHDEAFPSAVASLCAHEQEAFWPFHDKLFSSELLGQEVYIQYATDLGLDPIAFRACLASGRHDESIQADLEFARGIGVNATPTFFINGLSIVGAQGLPSFQKLIDQELAAANPG